MGADDRAGVFTVLQLVKKNKSKPSVLFTMGEELGGLGAMAFVKQFPEPPVPTKYIIEIDRRGKGQSVYCDCGNTKFEEYINSFGFTTHQGIFSDISFICPTWNVAGVNLSALYTIPVENVECCYHCINQFVDWCDNCGEPFFIKREGQKLCEVCANDTVS